MRTKMKSVQQVYLEHMNDSNCEVRVAWKVRPPHVPVTVAPELDTIQILFTGSLARIPSLKNSKIPGRNFISNTTQGKLKAMTAFYELRTKNKFQFGKDVMLYLQVLLCKGSRLDEDNGFAAVKDWLEPKTMRNRFRGWGIGLTENDKFITGEARHGWRIGLELPYTIITIRRYDDVADVVKEFDYKIGDLKGHESNSSMCPITVRVPRRKKSITA